MPCDIAGDGRGKEEEEEEDKKKSWGEIGRLGNKALPAENRDNGLNILVHCTGNLKAPR